jgi:hypothetical protein
MKEAILRRFNSAMQSSSFLLCWTFIPVAAEAREAPLDIDNRCLRILVVILFLGARELPVKPFCQSGSIGNDDDDLVANFGKALIDEVEVEIPDSNYASNTFASTVTAITTSLGLSATTQAIFNPFSFGSTNIQDAILNGDTQLCGVLDPFSKKVLVIVGDGAPIACRDSNNCSNTLYHWLEWQWHQIKRNQMTSCSLRYTLVVKGTSVLQISKTLRLPADMPSKLRMQVDWPKYSGCCL